MSDDDDMATGVDSDEGEFEFAYSSDEMSDAEPVEIVEEKVSSVSNTFTPVAFVRKCIQPAS